MEKSPICLKAKLMKVAFALLVISMLASAVAIMPAAKGQTSVSLTVYPTSGPVGSTVVVSGAGFQNALVSISFDGTVVSTTYTDAYNGVNSLFTVPSISPGQYTVTAQDNQNDYASTTFTVTTGSAPTPTASSAPTPTQYYLPTSPGPSSSENPYFYTYPPTTQSSSFWTPITISLVAAVAFIAVSVPTYMFTRRGGNKRKMMFEDEHPSHSSYTREPPAPPSRPATSSGYQSTQMSHQSTSTLAASRYSRPQSYGYNRQSSSSPMATRYNQPSSYSRPSTQYTKTCPHCKKP